VRTPTPPPHFTPHGTLTHTCHHTTLPSIASTLINAPFSMGAFNTNGLQPIDTRAQQVHQAALHRLAGPARHGCIPQCVDCAITTCAPRHPARNVTAGEALLQLFKATPGPPAP
jgi:hypothetical protein